MEEKTQNYLGIRNGVVVCVDQLDEHDNFRGKFFHAYDSEPVVFSDEMELLQKLDEFFNKLQFPFAATTPRSFTKTSHNSLRARTEEEKVMSDKEVLMHHGEYGTFIIRVQQRQNSSWQGRITWVDEDKTVYFRSVWEMMKLIDEALDTYRSPEELEEDPTWEEV